NISRVVLAFYDRVLDSDIIGDRFEETEMTRLIDHQTKFMAALLGGPSSHTPEHLRQVHHPLGLTEEEFAEMAVLLRETLDEHKFTPDDADEVMRLVAGYKDMIVGPENAA
ncbi:MAG: group 1 truncated hemoglobin, partial [Pseudomonadota bacterium]